MISFGEGQAIGALRQQIAELHRRLSSSEEQAQALSTKFTESSDRWSSLETKNNELRSTLAIMDELLSQQGEMLKRQTSIIDELCDRLDRQDDQMQALQGTLRRIEKQAVVDLDEIRSRNNDVVRYLKQRTPFT